MSVVSPLRVAFAGTPQFAVPALEALRASRHTIVGVLTQPDRPKGRGRQLTPSPVKALALSAGLPVFQPDTLRTPAAVQAVAALARRGADPAGHSGRGCRHRCHAHANG